MQRCSRAIRNSLARISSVMEQVVTVMIVGGRGSALRFLSCLPSRPVYDLLMTWAGVTGALARLAMVLLLAGCARKEAVVPAPLASVDKVLLLDIAQKAISARLASIPVENREPRVFLYTCYRDRASERTREMFEVRFRVKGSKRQVEKDGETVFQADEISVAIEPDGLIETGGVRKVVATYVSPDLSMLSRMESENSPIWGTPFRPVPGNTPLPRPDRSQVEGLAVQAIAKFIPAVDTRALQFDQLSFFDVVDPESSFTNACYLVTYWNTNSLKIAATGSKVTIDGEQVTVRMAADGQVGRDGVSVQPLHFVCNREMLEEWRRNATRSSAPPTADQPDAQASPAP